MRIFISHSSAEAALAEEICRDLEGSGYGCFIAPRDIRSGHEYAEELVNGIDSCDVMLLLLSERSNGSPHVLREVERAVSKNKSIIVYKLEEFELSKSMEYFLMTHQWLEHKPGRERSDILAAVERFSSERNAAEAAPAPAEEERTPDKEAHAPEKKERSLMKYLPAAAAVAVTAAAVIIALLMFRPSSPELTPDSLPAQGSAQTSGGETVSEVSSAPPVGTDAEASAAATEPAAASSESVTSAASAAASASFAQPAEQVTQPPETAAPNEAEPSAFLPELGSTLILGTYNEKPIEWRVIHISDDEKSAVVISDRILTMKAFDAAEGGKYNNSGNESYWTTPVEEMSEDIQREVRGDNRWERSNIRAWLNSAKEMVQYDDCAPAASAMSDYKNGYSAEAGFLNGFTKKELAVILPTEVTANGVTTTDNVFLLSVGELEWLYDADVSIYAKPTPEALEQDEANWYEMYLDGAGTTEFFWWLRDADSADACRVMLVNISTMDSISSPQSAGLEGYGVRPAMTIDLTAQGVAELFAGDE